MSTAPAITLQANLALTDDQVLRVQAVVRNQGHSPVYLLNALWDLDRQSQPIPDPEQIYRFVHEGTLRLLLGICPLPRTMTPLYRNLPEARPLAVGDAARIDLGLPLPVKEYNVYFPELQSSTYEKVKILSVELYLQYVEERADWKMLPSRITPGAVQIQTPAFFDAVRLVRSGPSPITLEALRRTDEFVRFLPPT